ncbi:MAG: 7-cyano-7-deazaguanine synthase QueC [Planctomycetota bacterium]|jgi:7-cyano-7-deazaguanine synthase
MPAVALLSGGLDSLVAATHAARHGGLVLALTIDYGQRSAARENSASAAIAAHLEAEHRIVAAPFLGEIAACALTRRDSELPEPTEADLDDLEESLERAERVWVPNRNGMMIHMAAGFAEALDADRIVVGFNREEAAAFPDNGPDFVEATNRALSFTLGRAMRVESPTIDLDKTGIVELGLRLKAPLHLVWSCYEAGPAHCFRCESCLRLKRALQEAQAWEELASQLGGK